MNKKETEGHTHTHTHTHTKKSQNFVRTENGNAFPFWFGKFCFYFLLEILMHC